VSNISWHEQILMKLSKYLLNYPSHISNIWLKSFGLLQNLTKNYDILQKLMTFHESWWNFTKFHGILLLHFHSVLMYFVNFGFRFWSFQKLPTKFQSLSDWFKISRFWTLQWQKLKKSISQLPTFDNALTKIIFNFWKKNFLKNLEKCKDESS
jgi:hypothetical protein